VALALALDRLTERGQLHGPALTSMLAAVSVGIVEGRPVLDLDYVEDSAAEVDMNVIRTGDGRYVEIQGTAETTPFSRERLDEILDLADKGIDELIVCQKAILGPALGRLMVIR
jgi:ribonuclease PH